YHPATSQIYTLSLHDALPILGDFQTNQSIFFFTDDLQKAQEQLAAFVYNDGSVPADGEKVDYSRMGISWTGCPVLTGLELGNVRSEEHTSELQSRFDLVCRLL